MIKVTVGSTNPVKTAATLAVLRRVYGDGVEVRAASVESGVCPANHTSRCESAKHRRRRSEALVEPSRHDAIARENFWRRRFWRRRSDARFSTGDTAVSQR
jgi:hypothetical protein